MEKRSEGPQTPYEVYCYNCRVTFAAGTPRCVHCGARLGGRPDRGEPMLSAHAPEDMAEPSLGRRLGGMSLWILIALAAALSRMCTDPG